MDFKIKHIAVVGGGIAGLSAAYHLLKNTSLPLKVSLIEKADYLGGKIQTDRIDGYVIEGGPDTFIATKPWAVKLCKELGIGESLQGTNPETKNTYILHNNNLHTLPGGLTMMIPTEIVPMIRTGLLDPLAKLRMGLDFIIPASKKVKDETIGNFVTRRIGRRAYENLIEPLMSGIYAGDGDKLSLQSTFPLLHELEEEHGGLVKGALALRKKRKALMEQRDKINGSTPKNRSIFLTPTTGLAELTEALTGFLVEQDVNIILENSVVEINPPTEHDVYQLTLSDGSTFACDGVVLATPPFASGELVQSFNTQLSEELNSIDYVSTATVSLGYNKETLEHTLNGYGYVIPRKENRTALASTWTSTKFPHRAPEDKALIRVFIGRAGQEGSIPWEEAELVQLAKNELAETLGIYSEPEITKVYIWEKAMPQYNLGHPGKLERIWAHLEEHPGLALAGNGYQGIGIPDCIHSGELAANTILDDLKILIKVN